MVLQIYCTLIITNTNIAVINHLLCSSGFKQIFFITQNELSIYELVHNFIEVLDKYFSQVVSQAALF